MRHILIALAGAATLLSGSAIAGQRADRSEKAEAKLAKALEGRVAGQPVNCINLRSVQSSQIFDRTAILYKVGSTYYVNRPTNGASSLDDDDILLTKTFSSELCSIDIVRLVDRSSRFETGFVGLGKFVPYKRPKKGA